MKNVGKLLTGYTNAGKPVYKKIPVVTHPFIIGDIIENEDGECFIVITTDEVVKKYPMDTNSSLDIQINAFDINRGTLDTNTFWVLGILQMYCSKYKKVGTADPKVLAEILAANKARDERDAEFWNSL
jgi:hypothetical protein